MTIKKRRIDKFLKSLSKVEGIVLKKQIVVPSILVDDPLNKDKSLLIMQSPVSLRKFNLLHKLDTHTVLENFQERSISLIGEKSADWQTQLLNDLNNFYIFDGLELIGCIRDPQSKHQNDYKCIFYRMPPVYKQFDSHYSIETHIGDIYEKEMSDLLNKKWKEERAVLKAVLSVMNDLSTHSRDTSKELEVEQQFLIFKKMTKTYRGKKIQISGFVVAPFPQEYKSEGDFALTKKLTNEEVINSMHLLGIVINTKLENSLLVYSID